MDVKFRQKGRFDKQFGIVNFSLIHWQFQPKWFLLHNLLEHTLDIQMLTEDTSNRETVMLILPSPPRKTMVNHIKP